jgi:hypothetical protein
VTVTIYVLDHPEYVQAIQASPRELPKEGPRRKSMQGRGAILVRRGKGGKRREVGMDAWGWQQLEPWLAVREQLRVGDCFASSTAPTRADHGHRTRFASSCGEPQSRLV